MCEMSPQERVTLLCQSDICLLYIGHLDKATTWSHPVTYDQARTGLVKIYRDLFESVPNSNHVQKNPL